MSCGFSSKKQISVFKHNDIIQEEEHGYYGKAQKFLFKNTDTKRGEKHVNHVLCLRLRFTRCDNVGLLF